MFNWPVSAEHVTGGTIQNTALNVSLFENIIDETGHNCFSLKKNFKLSVIIIKYRPKLSVIIVIYRPIVRHQYSAMPFSVQEHKKRLMSINTYAYVLITDKVAFTCVDLYALLLTNPGILEAIHSSKKNKA